MYSKMVISILCYFVSFILPMSSLKIVDSPDTAVWVKEGNNVTLLCTSDQPWQWCYWERETPFETTRYQTGQEYTTLKTFDPQVQFSYLDESSCGIKISGALSKEHQVFWFFILIRYRNICPI